MFDKKLSGKMCPDCGSQLRLCHSMNDENKDAEGGDYMEIYCTGEECEYDLSITIDELLDFMISNEEEKEILV